MSYSTRALYLSNWRDIVGIWKATKVSQIDPGGRGPRLSELHYLQGPVATRAVNQIVDYAGFFRDDQIGAKYTAIQQFDSEAWLGNGPDDAGVLTTNYLHFDSEIAQPRLQITRRYAAVPNQPFLVVRYELTNRGTSGVTYDLLDQVVLENVAAHNPACAVHAWYDAQRGALFADMTASGQFFVALGAFESVVAYQAGDDDEHDTAKATASPLAIFDGGGTLPDNGELRATRTALAFHSRVTVAPGATATASFYLAIRADRAALETAVDAARAQPASDWFAATAHAYRDWLAGNGRGVALHSGDSAVDDAFERALVVIKNAHNPVLGTFVATTNPFAYGYKTWVRDGSITAMALDASGHHAEAEQYWRWMAGVQGSDGTWRTTYSSWGGEWIAFVEPEYDSIGAFLYGVARHYQLTGNAVFLRDIWPAVQGAADWVLTNIVNANGLGAADYSIWEEMHHGLEHNSYTQAWYVAGLWGAQLLAEARGDTALCDWYAGGPGTILTTMQRPSSWTPPGMWNVAGYYNRAVAVDNLVHDRVDSSSNMLIALGVVDHESERARRHIERITRDLSHDVYGISRYENDDFYFTNAYSPGGDEALGMSPMWPQMSMWVAIHELREGRRDAAMARLSWCVGTMARGYMPPGEAVSYVTRQAAASSMCEPMTASSFVLAALAYQGSYELRLAPPLHNAGTYKSIGLSAIGDGNWDSWADVPYFVAPPATGAAAAIRRVYVANDGDHLFVRVDVTGPLDGAERPPLLLLLYARDLAGGGGECSHLGREQNPLRRPMSHLVERPLDGNAFSRWLVARGEWGDGGALDGASAWRWDAAGGRIAAAIPIAALATGVPDAGNVWTHLQLTLGERDAASGATAERSSVVLHYRVSRIDQPWIYGNIER